MSASKRLALLLPDLGGGGAERVAITLAEHFLAGGHEVDFVLMRAQGPLLTVAPAGAHIVDLRADRIRSAILPIKRYLQQRRPDAVQVSMWPLTVAAIVARRLARSPTRLVTSDHTILSKQYPPTRPLLHHFLKWSISTFYPRADARIIVAEEAANDLAQVGGIDRSSLEVIYNPVAAPPTHAVVPDQVERLWNQGSPRIINVGALKDEKNQALLLRSFAAAFAGTPAKLIILGEGPLRPKLEKMVADLGIADQVRMPGFAADPWPFYASADMFVLSSDFEGYPLVLVEALRSGLRIVSTECPSGPSEILENGRYGRLVPVGDDAGLAAAMREACAQPLDPEALRARAELLSGRATSDRYLSLMLGTAA